MPWIIPLEVFRVICIIMDNMILEDESILNLVSYFQRRCSWNGLWTHISTIQKWNGRDWESWDKWHFEIWYPWTFVGFEKIMPV